MRDIEPDRERIREHLEHSLIGATALSPHTGYEMAAQISLTAQRQNISLREAALKLGINAQDFNAWVNPSEMTQSDRE